MDGLLNATLPFAKDQLAKRGEFLPFGAAVTRAGETRFLASYSGETGATSVDLLEMLVEGARDQASSLRAVAIVADALIEGKRDAIRIDIEHRDGNAISVALPYAKHRLGRGIDYGDMVAAEGVRRIWT